MSSTALPCDLASVTARQADNFFPKLEA